MDVALEMAKGYLDNDLTWNLHDLLAHRNDWWVPGKLVELRGRLEHYWRVRESTLWSSPGLANVKLDHTVLKLP